MLKRFLGIGLLFSFLLLFGCSKELPQNTYNSFIKDLEEMNFLLDIEDVDEDILEGKRKWVTIDSTDNMSIYLYSSMEKMEEDASHLDSGGTSYNNGDKSVEIEWVSYPHFFKKDNMIVNYVGDNKEIIKALEKLLGEQFAGYTSSSIEDSDLGETQVFTYKDFKVEVTNVENVRIEKMVDDGGTPWEYKIIEYYPKAIAKILEADMSDPTYSEDNKPHPNWGIELLHDEVIRITDDLDPFEITEDIVGIFNLEASLYILKFEIIK